MFDISFSELLVIAVVALVVIGPEKLPKVARTAGAFFGRLQRFVTQVKEEVNRETRFAELQTLQQEVQSGLQQTYDEIEHSILPGEPAVDAVVDAEVASTAKKPRKPRQRKMTVADEAAATATAEQPVLDADPQAELFAVADNQKKPRLPRHTAKKAAAAVSDAEQNPLA